MTRRPTLLRFPKNHCQACGVAYMNHLGVVGTCAKVQALKLLLLEARQHLPRGHELARRIEVEAG